MKDEPLRATYLLKKLEEKRMIQTLTKENFNEKTDKGVVLIDFWASWCGPCKMQSPILDDLASEYPNNEVTIAKVNVDEQPELAQAFGVMSIPTLLVKKDGAIADRFVGVQIKDRLKQVLDSKL
jgi:thioredoxin 1